jgi:hypothetical protein
VSKHTTVILLFVVGGAITILALMESATRNEVAALRSTLNQSSEQAEQHRGALDSTADAASGRLALLIEGTLSRRADSLVAARLESLRDSVAALRLRRAQEELLLQSAEERRSRAQAGLPGIVTLDSLGHHYARIRQGNERFSFETRRGRLGFSSGDVVFGFLENPVKLAWLRIGKEKSTETGELIRAWLRETEQSKTWQGYHQVSKTTRPADYGEQTETVLEKGDAYCRTYFLYERVQGTYARHSLQYTYYVEIGSKARKLAHERQQYTKGLGG